jgi:hypothetical protein
VVDGTAYLGSRLRFGYVGSIFRDDAEDVANLYQPQSTVTVHHHPRRPSMSVLEPGFDRANVSFLGVTIVIVVFAYFMSN